MCIKVPNFQIPSHFQLIVRGFNIRKRFCLYDGCHLMQNFADTPKRSKFFRPVLLVLPQYLANSQYKNPADIKNGAFQIALNTPDHMFEYFQSHPGDGETFNNHMKGYSDSRARWIDPGCVPIDEVIGRGAHQDKESVLLVDIGGGFGHDLEVFEQKYPELPGRLILQDLPAVIGSFKKSATSEIEVMGYDFFTKQPIKGIYYLPFLFTLEQQLLDSDGFVCLGARAYYLHSILHDWDDDQCREILNRQKEAMTKGYSKILINENVIPDTGAHLEATGVDLILMAMLSSGERNEKQWRNLLSSAGLRVVNIWTYEIGTESLIEAELE
jgi:hypothetical protein